MTKKKDMENETQMDEETVDADSKATEESVDENTEDLKDEESGEDAKANAREESFETKYLRMAADFQNFKRRTDEEKSKIYANANEKFGTDLLEVLDNFERAIEQDKKNEADAQFLAGMEMILKQLKDVLKKNGIEEIDALGKEFDPNFHHAVVMENSDKYDNGHVTDVMQKGYMLKDRVIRPCMVKVAE